jgi:prenyltransferase/squalene oxidase-like repeat protein
MTDWRGRQNRDGGWAYHKGGSWTEPTALVLLAQSVTQAETTINGTRQIDRQTFDVGLNFLRSTQRQSGGWSPRPDVDESTWVTALVALLPEDAIGADRLQRAVAWLESQTGRESGWSYRLRQTIAGNKEKYPEGWPWFPGTAAWVIPTSFGILAFERALRRGENARLRERVNAGREFLLGRMCADGGWNHGSNRALGRDGDSYPETTGIALVALHGAARENKAPRETMARAKDAAHLHLATCRTAEGAAWLRMGLAAHGESVPFEPSPDPRTTMDAALTAIASAGRNPLLS